MRRIVVGTDGSQHATAAMQWAAEEARAHGANLEVVLVWSYLDQYHHDRSDSFRPDYTEAMAREALASWVTEALGVDAAVGQRVECDLPARALLEASDAADLLVLGGRGRGGFEGLLLGSVSERVAQLATRPVAVVRDAARVSGGRVLVGVDGSSRSVTALRWAAAEARARGADLEVVHAWRPGLILTPPLLSPYPDFSALEEAGRALLDTALADASLDGVEVGSFLSSATPARALIDRAAEAALIVVGTRGLGRMTGALLGSVSRQLLHHAPCPVVVI
jgi:nucleotide-binding universal stress UspA family protein